MLSHSYKEIETYGITHVSVCQELLSRCWTFFLDLMSVDFFHYHCHQKHHQHYLNSHNWQ